MADAATSRVNIVNRALTKLGEPASYSIDDQSNLGGIVDAVWAGVEARVTATFDWSFCRKTVQLSQISSPPNNGWTYGFALPGDRVGEPMAVLQQAGVSEQYLRDFMIEQGNIYTNNTPIWARIRVLLDPQYWDLGFAEAFALALAAGLALPLLQDGNIATEFEKMAFGSAQEQGSGGLFGKLIALNRAAQPQGRNFMANDPLTRARFM